MNIDYAQVGANIKKRRKELGLTQETLAEQLSVSVGYVSQVERGVTKISLDLLAKVSSLLQYDIGYFVSGTAVDQEDYLKTEWTEKFVRLTPPQRRVVLGLIDLLQSEEPV